MSKYRMRHFDASRQQERRPVHSMKSENVLADEMKRGPVAFEVVMPIVAPPERSDVIQQRVEPDVNSVIRIARNRNPPLDRPPADCLVSEPAGNKGPHLIASSFGSDKIRP